jgi:RNA polymerase sigma factor (sigma-70 family)
VAIERNRTILRQLQTLFNVGVTSGLTDGQLLERFATRQGESAELAFAALIERHGPMVLRVCRGILRNDHDAQDAFQATFLILVRRGGSLWVRDSLGPWLHRVACRVAIHAQRTRDRRMTAEHKAAKVGEACSDRALPDDLAHLLHEQLNRLPDRYRLPIVLCDLEGRTYEETARHLGWPIGTVKSRLARGRDQLRDRLRRRGLAPHSGLLAAALRSDPLPVVVSSELIDSTVRCVVQTAIVRTMVRGSAVVLAQGVLKSMTLTLWLKTASVVILLGAMATGVHELAQQEEAKNAAPQAVGQAQTGPEVGRPTFEVTRGKLQVTVVERGNVESADSLDVFCLVEGGTSIISILPEGTPVKKGQVVCELDSSFARDKLVNQEITTKGAEAAYLNAKLARQIAEIAVTEYREGIFAGDLKAVMGMIADAQLAIEKADARLARTRRAQQRLQNAVAARQESVTPTQIMAELDIQDRLDAAEQTIEREKRALDLAQTKKTVLEKYTQGKTIKQHESEVEKARSNELAKQAMWELEQSKEAKLRRQIASCTLPAPGDGIVVYANDPRRQPNSGRTTIEEGAAVRERQKIFSIPNLRKMQINTKVHEAWVDRIESGQRARIRVDAFADQILTGKVEKVAPVPDVFQSWDAKVYTTRVAIDGAPAGLRPGMTAQVDILVTERDDVLTVPVSAVLQFDNRYYVVVKKPGGGFDWREVTLGLSTGYEWSKVAQNLDSSKAVIEVKQGLQSGEFIIDNPRDLMNDGGKRAKREAPSEPAAKPAPR